MLGVEEPELVVVASQSMIEVQDDTDLEAEAKFNMNLWLSKAQIDDPAAKNTESPMTFRQKALKKVYSLP